HTPPTPIHTLSLHDALPICMHHDRQAAEARASLDARDEIVGDAYALDGRAERELTGMEHERVALFDLDRGCVALERLGRARIDQDRKSTRLNSSHVKISYAV